MGYSKVEVRGGAAINYLHVKKYEANDTEIENVVNNEVYLPEWDTDTVMLATYQNTLDASTIDVTEGDMVGYKIQRKDVGENVMYPVTDTSHSRLQDYNAGGMRSYQYYIFPIILGTNGEKTLGAPIVTDEIIPKWDGCTIVGLLETEHKNEYTVDEDNIWAFKANVEQDSYVLNMDKTYSDGFGRFPKRSQGDKKYISGGMNSLFGTINCISSSFAYGVAELEKWEDFCHSPNLKLFKDLNGRILPVDIKETSSSYLFHGGNSPIVTSFSYIQMASSHDISVYGTAVL